MTRDERHAMWQARIAAFKASGESSVKNWCTENNVSYQSMYDYRQCNVPRVTSFVPLNDKKCTSE